MCLVAPDVSAAQVLSAFHHDAPYLFLGAAFVAVGIVSAMFSALRPKHEPLLLYFALFAVIYGLRLWIQAELLGFSIRGSWFYPRLRAARMASSKQPFRSCVSHFSTVSLRTGDFMAIPCYTRYSVVNTFMRRENEPLHACAGRGVECPRDLASAGRWALFCRASIGYW